MSSGEPALPTSLGPYRLVRRLGAGGMAEVHLARRFGASGWEKAVAIKVLRAEHRGRAELERHLIAEARLGARFAHPSLVGVHDLGLQGGIYYVCMDLVDGADLAALIARRPLPRALALHVAEALAGALAHVHDLTDESGRPLGVVHRDVSPGNVLLSRSGEVKLSDFGIAKATAEDDRTWGRLRKGKYAYMEPEQIVGGALTGAADLFALGVTLHELLLGRRPFDGEGPLATMEALRRAELAEDPARAGLGEVVDGLLRRLLARAPEARPDAVEAVAILQRARREEPPVGALDLATWVRTTLDEVAASADEAPPPSTLAMDDLE